MNVLKTNSNPFSHLQFIKPIALTKLNTLHIIYQKILITNSYKSCYSNIDQLNNFNLFHNFIHDIPHDYPNNMYVHFSFRHFIFIVRGHIDSNAKENTNKETWNLDTANVKMFEK